MEMRWLEPRADGERKAKHRQIRFCRWGGWGAVEKRRKRATKGKRRRDKRPIDTGAQPEDDWMGSGGRGGAAHT